MKGASVCDANRSSADLDTASCIRTRDPTLDETVDDRASMTAAAVTVGDVPLHAFVQMAAPVPAFLERLVRHHATRAAVTIRV